MNTMESDEQQDFERKSETRGFRKPKTLKTVKIGEVIHVEGFGRCKIEKVNNMPILTHLYT